MEHSEWIALFIQQHQIVNSFWNLYAIVAVGLGTVLATSDTPIEKKEVLLMLLLLFFVFSFTNYLAIKDGHIRLISIWEVLNSIPATSGIYDSKINSLKAAYEPISLSKISVAHILNDIITIIVFYLIVLFRKNKNNKMI